MDGLEIVEIQFKQLATIIDYRIESEYFLKKYIENEKRLINIPRKRFNTIALTSNGRAYSSNAFSMEGEIYISKIGDVTNKREIDAWDKVYQKEFCSQKGALLKDADLLMTLTGDPPDVGKVNIVSPNKRKCTWNQRVARIERLGNDYISNYSLYAILSSEVCRMQMERFAKGIRQRNLGNDCFSFVEIPVLRSKLQKALDKLVQNHIKLLNEAQEQCLKAEQLLLSILGMSEFIWYQQTALVKLFSKSYGLSGRLDAEYYQTKYDQLFTTLAAYTTNSLGGPDGIADFRKSIEPGSESYGEEGIPFVRVSDITKFGVSKPEIKLPADIVKHPEALFPKKDSILFSKDGSVGIAYKLEEDAQFITSSALLQLTVRDTEKVLPDYLTLVLNSPVVQLQAERASSGAVIQHWKPSEIQQVIIPVLDMVKQKKLSQMVQESFSLRRRSEQLLDYAKQAVELAIEQGEKVAMVWLEERGGKR